MTRSSQKPISCQARRRRPDGIARHRHIQLVLIRLRMVPKANEIILCRLPERQPAHGIWSRTMKWIMAMLALFVCASTSRSAIFTVSPGESIQTAVNSADYGDTVLIQDGSYAETVILYGATLTIGSGFLLDQDTTHVANTVIYPNDAHADTNSCFVYAYGEEQSGRLIGLTLTGGTGTYWNFADAFCGRSSIYSSVKPLRRALCDCFLNCGRRRRSRRR